MTSLLNNVLFWTAVIFCVISAYKVYLSRQMDGFGAKEWVISEKTYRILFALAILAAVFVRVYKFGQVPGGFNQDGAMAAVDAKALAEYGTDRFGMRYPVHLTAWKYSQMASLLSYLMIPFVKCFGVSPIAMRLPLLLASAAGLVCLYGFTKDVFGKEIALIVLWFAAINPWHILQSRWALEANLYPHFFMFGVFFLNRAIMRMEKRKRYLILCMMMFGLCMYCYGIAIYTMPVFLAVACIYLLAAKKISLADAALSAAVYLFVAWPFIAVMAINFLQWETIETPWFTLPYFSESVRSNDILFFSSNMLSQLIENGKAMMGVTLLQTKDLPWNDVRNFGTMYLFSMPFAVLGLCGLFYEFGKKTGAVLLAFFLGTGVWCGLTTNAVNVNRMNIIYYPIIILIGIGIYDVLRMISLPRLKRGIAIAYGVMFLLFVREYFTGFAADVSAQFEENLGDAFTSLKECAAEKIYITTSNQMVSEILMMFWCDIDAEYFQGVKTPEGELPYAEKYRFHAPGELTVDTAEDADYRMTPGELEFFDESLYAWEQFGGYYVVTKKQ
ncbi:MAG: glycosyltransferase family 39 protein [Lachnospiraceae bacterium]|nr:glycosyltransferase family 39 protein [Lachnospiraceae bacterium]